MTVVVSKNTVHLRATPREACVTAEPHLFIKKIEGRARNNMMRHVSRKYFVGIITLYGSVEQTRAVRRTVLPTTFFFKKYLTNDWRDTPCPLAQQPKRGASLHFFRDLNASLQGRCPWLKSDYSQILAANTN